MNKYLTQNGPTLFKNAAELRITAVNRADTIANFEIGITQAKKNYLIDDKVFKAKLKPLYNELYSMGVISKEQARQRLIVDMEQKKRGQAEFITAGFQTELNSFAAAANTETAKLWNEYVKEGFMDEKIGFNVQNGIEKNLISKTDELTKQYKEDIKKLKLTLPEERQLFRALDEDAGFRKRYLGSIKKQVQDAHKLDQANSLEAFQVEQIQDPLKEYTLPDLQQKGLSHDDIVDYNKTLIKKTYDFSVFSKDVESLTRANGITKNLSPESSATDRLKATKDIASIKNPTLKAQALNNYQEKTDPEKFYEPMNQGFTAWEKDIDNLFAEGDLAEIGELDLTKFPDQGSGTAGIKQMGTWLWEIVTPESSEPITELQFQQAKQSVKDEYKRIWRLEGEKVARVYLSERKVELQEGMSSRKFQQYYIDPQESNKEIIILEGVSYYNYIDPETGEKILEPVGK